MATDLTRNYYALKNTSDVQEIGDRREEKLEVETNKQL